MVAQTKADARSVAAKPDPAGKKWLQKEAVIDGREALDEQVTAAAVVDVDQAQAVAAAGVTPTDAPADGIGLMAQSTVTPTDPPVDTSTTGSTGTTPPPEVEEPATGYSPWVVGAAAILGFGAVAAVVDNNDDDDDDTPVAVDPPAAPPPAVPGPAPAPGPGPSPGPAPAPVNTPPTSQNSAVVASEDGTTALGTAPFFFSDAVDTTDTRGSVRIGSITPSTIDPAASESLAVNATTGHGYELIQGATTWVQANAIAVARGGYLAVLDTAEELDFAKDNFGSFGPTTGEAGAWIGLAQLSTATAVADGWNWVDGTPLPGDSPLWNNDFGGLPGDFRDEPFEAGLENHEADYGAISEGSSVDDTSLIYDRGTGSTHPTPNADTLPQFLVEYNTTAPLTLNGAAVVAGQVIAEADLANLTWNSVFNTGGSLTFAVGDRAPGDPANQFSTPDNTLRIDPAPAATSLAAMIDDQNGNNLV